MDVIDISQAIAQVVEDRWWSDNVRDMHCYELHDMKLADIAAPYSGDTPMRDVVDGWFALKHQQFDEMPREERLAKFVAFLLDKKVLIPPFIRQHHCGSKPGKCLTSDLRAAIEASGKPAQAAV